uniref:(northern house mosquito) hypothetical protein n=1 Tax=Culex pipiens TaxID=7175 RepID=A0A8D8KDH7_CULPI
MHVVQRSQPLLARCCQPKTKHFSHHNTPHHTTEIDPLFRRTCSPGLHADFCPRCSLSVDVHNLTVVFFLCRVRKIFRIEMVESRAFVGEWTFCTTRSIG